jgi:tRNA(adenine34) deaminase
MMERGDSFFMNEALKEAKKAFEAEEVPVGAIMVYRNEIIARAHNLTQTLANVTAHAELLAITKASEYLGIKYLMDCTLYVTLEPCSMCAGALGWSQIGRIVYGASDEKRGYQRYAPEILHKKTIVQSGVMSEESAQLMKDFFKIRR